MGYKDRVPHKLQKFGQNHIDFWEWKHHSVVDTRQLLNIKRNRHIWIDKGRKLVRNPSVLHLHRSDLNNLVLLRAESRGFNIKNHICIGKALVSGIFHQLFGVIHQITLHPVEHLKGISLVQGVISIGKCLDAAVVRHRDGGHAPLLGPFDDILHLGNPVHVAHLGMAVKLHPLFQAVVHALAGKILRLLDSHNGA